ncbi:hypothetical protein M9H77_17367 [Catharanthus roseus]|uniref:Uncharacterized protein n=1 Tax=Catharanthus roseus TaxID=4058 RepID=A0ACC0B4F3_CATRO|nr:hypothetical protein M9H77_17367 [Catharanthus roseus]
MKIAWESKVKDRLRDLLGDVRGKNKRSSWIDESYWAKIKDLTERFSRSKYLEELHKHQKADKKGEYEKFHEVRKAEEDAKASSTPMPDGLQLMPIVVGRVSRDHLYGAGSEAVNFIVESSRAVVGLAPCCLDHDQRLMQRVEDAVSRVFVTFDEHMRQLFEHNQLAYIPFPLMVPLVRVAMSAYTSTSTLTATVMGTSEVLTRDSSIPPPLPDPPLFYPTPRMLLLHPLLMLHRLHFDL